MKEEEEEKDEMKKEGGDEKGGGGGGEEGGGGDLHMCWKDVLSPLWKLGVWKTERDTRDCSGN
jgi:hypothetical protein